ncbi:MAG: MerR family transcriptional regulator [Lachnospiraceae bacterium]|nr:MerR family transcriptional regulator [Lachnospiraceae bacterium]
MKNYFLISEFAKLRGININSLRYYEKLGLLKPAFVDENTNYRYYSAEQLTLLNKIILCIQLGISLKEMAAYIDDDGNLQSQRLLEQGRIVARKLIEEMQNNLKYIEMSLRNIEENKEFKGREGMYFRNIEERKVIMTGLHSGTTDVKKLVSEISEIYTDAQKKGYYPILPAGQILRIDRDGNFSIRLFLEVLNSPEGDAGVSIFPKGKYSCVQMELDPERDLVKAIKEWWPTEEELTIMVDNVMLETYSFEIRFSELRKLEMLYEK